MPKDTKAMLRRLLASYDTKIAAAEHAAEKLRVLRRAVVLLLEGEGERVEQKPTVTGPYTQLTVPDAAERVLREHGGPMPVDEITKAVIEGGWRTKAKQPKFTVTGALLRDKRFERCGRATYRLRSGAGAGPSAAVVSLEQPETGYDGGEARA